MRKFLIKYKWHLGIVLAVYLGVAIGLYLMTESPQSVPFLYQIN